MLIVRYLLAAGLMVWYIGVRSQNPPITHSPDSCREENKEDHSRTKEHNASIPQQRTLPSQQTYSSYPTQDREREKTNSEQERMWPPSAGWAAVYVALVSAFATSIYAVISWWQWRVLKTQNRPWIMVTPDKPEGWPPTDTGPCTFRLRWSVENVGKSPAFLTQLWADLVYARHGMNLWGESPL